MKHQDVLLDGWGKLNFMRLLKCMESMRKSY